MRWLLLRLRRSRGSAPRLCSPGASSSPRRMDSAKFQTRQSSSQLLSSFPSSSQASKSSIGRSRTRVGSPQARRCQAQRAARGVSTWTGHPTALSRRIRVTSSGRWIPRVKHPLPLGRPLSGAPIGRWAAGAVGLPMQRCGQPSGRTRVFVVGSPNIAPLRPTSGRPSPPEEGVVRSLRAPPPFLARPLSPFPGIRSRSAP